MATKWVYMFKEGNATMRNLLGGKGANLRNGKTRGDHRKEIRRQRESASRFRTFRRKSFHAGYDGHDPEPWSE